MEIRDMLKESDDLLETAEWRSSVKRFVAIVNFMLQQDIGEGSNYCSARSFMMLIAQVCREAIWSPNASANA
jgi:hypothetical protein